MAKVISTLVSILLLVFANQASVHLKRKGILPVEDKAQPELIVSNDIRMAASPVEPLSSRNLD
jgi:hypothetical protein